MAGYDLGPVLSVKGIAEGVENSNYLLATRSGQFILTLYEKRVDAADLPFFLGLMEHLAARHQLLAAGAQLVGKRPRPPFPAAGGDRHVSRPVGAPAPGRALRAVGGVAELHRRGRFSLTRCNALSVRGWRRYSKCRWLRRQGRAAARRRLRELDHPSARVMSPPLGFIHRPLPDNVSFNNALSGLIDSTACNDMPPMTWRSSASMPGASSPTCR